ncbi:MAG: histidinol phosphate phosphatase domain-containing protein [Syntrophaceae bacterium]
MIDLHTHTVFSDGDLIPAELVRRAAARGCKAVAITDHADHSNIDFIIPRIVNVCRKMAGNCPIKMIPGVELTHVIPAQIRELAAEARSLGASIVIVHGETIVEPVVAGTNLAALNSPIDILAHPGLLTEEEARLAAERGIFLEVTARKGHSLTNGHVVKTARKYNARLVLNTDSHSPRDLIDLEMARKVAKGAGMDEAEIESMFGNSRSLVEKISGPK